MAPERSSRAGGFNLPGVRNSALATAALTSVALFSQTADASPQPGDEAPSREDVQQRVSSLYARAEDDTGQLFVFTEAAQDGDDGLEPGRRQRLDHPPPDALGLGPAVDEHEGRALAADDDVLADAVGLDVAARERVGEALGQVRCLRDRADAVGDGESGGECRECGVHDAPLSFARPTDRGP